MRHPAAEPLVALGVLEEVNDLGQLLLGLVDPGDVVERHTDLGRVDAPRLRAAEVPEPAQAAAATCRRSAHQPVEQPDQQQRRAEPEDQVSEERGAARRRFGVDLDALELRRELASWPEAGDLGREQRGRRRRLRGRRVPQLLRERPVDRVALGRDRLDVTDVQLVEEERAERHRHPRLRGRLEEQDRQPVEREQGDEEDPEAAPAVRRRRLMLVRRAAAVGSRRDPPALLVLDRQPVAALPPVAPGWRLARGGVRLSGNGAPVVHALIMTLGARVRPNRR